MQMNGIWGSIFEVVSDVINEASFLQIDSEQSHPDGAWAKLKTACRDPTFAERNASTPIGPEIPHEFGMMKYYRHPALGFVCKIFCLSGFCSSGDTQRNCTVMYCLCNFATSAWLPGAWGQDKLAGFVVGHARSKPCRGSLSQGTRKTSGAVTPGCYTESNQTRSNCNYAIFMPIMCLFWKKNPKIHKSKICIYFFFLGG